jgi:phosphotransferase system  glucose/maltose/N-acetylglucosamine-specific IIC component
MGWQFWLIVIVLGVAWKLIVPRSRAVLFHKAQLKQLQKEQKQKTKYASKHGIRVEDMEERDDE